MRYHIIRTNNLVHDPKSSMNRKRARFFTWLVQEQFLMDFIIETSRESARWIRMAGKKSQCDFHCSISVVNIWDTEKDPDNELDMILEQETADGGIFDPEKYEPSMESHWAFFGLDH